MESKKISTDEDTFFNDNYYYLFKFHSCVDLQGERTCFGELLAPLKFDVI